MRRIAFTLCAAAAAAGVWFSYQATNRRAPTLAAARAATSSPSTVRHADTDVRIHLAPEQQRQASAAGGFAQAPRSLLRVDRRMHYGDYVWNDKDVPAGPVLIRVDLRTQLLSVFRAGHEIGTAVALYGADSKQTPLGSFPILWKGKDHRSSLYDAPMPYTLRLTGDGVAIHGSDVRWGAATHGCVGVPTEFAKYLFEQAKVGDIVTIVRSAPVA
jgi:lipoprotein-anchoring transpeptidase ErfK/SrfK